MLKQGRVASEAEDNVVTVVETKNSLIWLWLSLAVIICDQLSKWLAVTWLNLYDPVPIFPLFNLTLAYNMGAAFNFLSTAGGWQRWALGLVAFAVSVFIIGWLYRTPRQQKLLGLSLALILGGAVGNLIDRLRLGYVIDFLDVYVGNWHWPAFNIADSAITVGTILLVYQLLFTADKNTQAS